MAIIILEGPECAGKTTLAKRLSEQTGYPIVHRSKPETDEERNNMLQMYYDAINEKRDVIFDRCWYSEMVYGKVMRDKTYIDKVDMDALELAMAKNGGGIIIHCTDDILRLWHRCNDRGEDYVTDVDTLDAIRSRFEYVLHKIPHRIPVVRYELSKSMPEL